MSSAFVPWAAAALLAVSAVLAVALALEPRPADGEGDSGNVKPRKPSGGSMVTVRRVGGVTSVVIREGVRDHWEGDGGVPAALLPPEVTRAAHPALYAEYLSPDTPPSRRYAIIDELYSMGFTLPYCKDLHALWKAEEARSKAAPKGPVDLTIDQGLRDVPQPDLGADSAKPRKDKKNKNADI